MSERKIDPKFNIHKEYRKMFIMNPYRNSVGLLPQTQEVLDRADALGFTKPIPSTIAAMNTLISKTLANGTFWTGMDLLSNAAYNDVNCANFSLINLVNPNGNLGAIHGGNNYSTRGWKPNGTDGYMATGYNPSLHGINYNLNNAGRGAIVYDVGVVGGGLRYLMGCTEQISEQNMYLNPTISDTTGRNAQRINNGGGTITPNVPFFSTGLKCLFRDNATSIRGYNNGVETKSTSNSTVIDKYEININRRAYAYTDTGTSLIYFGKSFTLAEIEQFRTDYNEYLIEIGLTAFA